jgi:DUF917 family protein
LRRLEGPDLEAAILGGLVLSAGGSGLASSQRHRTLGEAALREGPVHLSPLERLSDDDAVLVATAVGAPGQARARTEPRDAVDAARALIEASGCEPKGVIPGHVPGLYAWIIASALGIPLVDAATNGRAHPTVKMGGMGLASQPQATLWQAGCAQGFRVLVHGDLMKTSNVMRAAAVQNGGLINAVRGPFGAAFLRRNGAPGAISFALGFGAAMLSERADARVAAAVRYLNATILVDGEVRQNTVRYESGFDVGAIRIGDVTLGVYNELMSADSGARRLASFPDLLASLDPLSGAPIAISALTPGTRVAILAAHRRYIPLGAGVYDRAAYPEVEAAMGIDLATYAFNSRGTDA